ncbi:MAG: hypothetical protein DME57_05205 [Verrucomicrobia bacterium]|nr:MAG: hypothetical protein DME57_05205 [Verrucomicrobiota bacterium]
MWVGILICALVFNAAQFARALTPEWDPGVPKDLFQNGNPPERLRPAKCKECKEAMEKLQAAMDDWYAMELSEGQQDRKDAVHIQDTDKNKAKNAEGDAKINEAKAGLGQPKDGGKEAQKKQGENSAKDAKEPGNKGKKAKEILKDKIKKLLKELQDCEKNKCKEPQETTPTPTPRPTDETTPTPTPATEEEKPPTLPNPITLPTPPPCFNTDAERKAFVDKWQPIATDQGVEARKAREIYNLKDAKAKAEPWGIYWQKKEAIHKASADALQKIIDDADDPKKTPVPCPKKTTTGGGGTKPTPTPKGRPKRAPRITTGGNVSYDGSPMEDFCTEISDNKVKVDITGTGETIGHIADARISNLTDESIAFTIPAAVLESRSGKNQNYGIPHTTDVALRPHEAKTIPLDGICLDRHKPPVGKGIGDDLAFNDCDPDARIPHDQSDRMLRIAETVYEAADELEEDGKLKEIPYKDPKKRKEIVEQWATWIRMSEVTGDPPPTKDDLKKVVEKQVGKVPPDKQKKIDEGIDTIFDKIELTNEKAKDLDKPGPEEETTPAIPSGTGDNVSNDTPTPAPETQEKKKKVGKNKKKKWPKPVQDWIDKWHDAEKANGQLDWVQQDYYDALMKYCEKNSPHWRELKDACDNATKKGVAKGATQADRDDANKACAELKKQEDELSKDFDKTDDAEKANADEKEAGKNIDDATKDSVKQYEKDHPPVKAVW